MRAYEYEAQLCKLKDSVPADFDPAILVNMVIKAAAAALEAKDAELADLTSRMLRKAYP